MQILEWNNLTGVHCGSSAIRNVINFFSVLIIQKKFVLVLVVDWVFL